MQLPCLELTVCGRGRSRLGVRGRDRAIIAGGSVEHEPAEGEGRGAQDGDKGNASEDVGGRVGRVVGWHGSRAEFGRVSGRLRGVVRAGTCLTWPLRFVAVLRAHRLAQRI